MTRQLFASIHQFDVLAFSWCMNRKRREHLTQVGRYVSATADGPLYALMALVLYALHDAFDARLLQTMALAFVVERVIYLLVKRVCKRNRPQDALINFHSFIRPSDQFSFPSGHTSCAFLFATFLVALFPAAALVWWLWAASVGLSRIFLGVHFPTDTVVGAFMGASVALWAMGYVGL